jgi:hypothetical protein
MKISNFYLKLCRNFHNLKFPSIKFKEFDVRTKLIYQKYFNVHCEDVNKATLFLFLTINLIFLSISILIPDFGKFIFLFISFIISTLLSYWFNTIIFRFIKKEGSKINAILHLIKIYHSLIQNSLEFNSDKTLAFISLIKEFNSLITGSFKEVLKFIQEGFTPENYLDQVITFSEDFDLYLKEMLLNQFETKNQEDRMEGSLERDFKVFIKQIESRLAIIFFIGTFFPIGMCFLILFQIINVIILLLILPLYFLILKILHKKFIKKDIFLLGLIKDYKKSEKQKFYELITFLKSFSLNLKYGKSPEKAFIDAFLQIKNRLKCLYDIIENQSKFLINFVTTFSGIIEIMKSELNSTRYSIILEVIKKLVLKNSLKASSKILLILDLLNQHQKLENKLETIFKGERFKGVLFLFILPFILGIIGGIFPSFFILLNNIEIRYGILLTVSISQVLLIYLILLFCLIISSIYFLKIINLEQKNFLIMISVILYTLLFTISFFSVRYFL